MRSLIQYLKSIFHKEDPIVMEIEDDTPGSKYCLQVAESFQDGDFKEFSLRRSSGRGRWKGDVLSLINTYIFLLKLPEVRNHTIEKSRKADSVEYTVHLSLTDMWKLSTLSLKTRNYAKLEFRSKDHVLLEIRLLIHNK